MISTISQATNQLKSNNRGFTLIELLIALAILGILAAIVIPSYNAQVRSTRRGDAVASLVQFAQTLENCRSDTLAYNDGTCTAPFNGGVQSDRQFYNITLGDLSATTFTLTATPVNADSRCVTYTYNQAGVQTAVDADGNDTRVECWKN